MTFVSDNTDTRIKKS